MGIFLQALKIPSAKLKTLLSMVRSVSRGRSNFHIMSAMSSEKSAEEQDELEYNITFPVSTAGKC